MLMMKMTSFAEETGDHLLRSASSTDDFRWIWLVFEDPHGGLWICFRLIRIDPRCVTCDYLINDFWSTAIVFFQHFFTPIDTNLFWAIVKLCGIQREQICLAVSCNIESLLVEEMRKDASIARYVTWRSCIICSRTARSVFEGPSRIWSLSDRRPQLNSFN